ncbi:cobalt-zinc-cadmium efflux system protein [Fontimonas thermophila]|uniref:Cobalt-zinc-cadmium efflux system protein n=1 Tax=Fontimonas thermophila TaxID=1076937 RepID=A0A1I2J289_9GAMM|nr:cation diffusion facilitator family transporter [Fontimonas thermophila]SFF48842.1 cobalt-zinc-cadmium efflux system protein [Fontimonas thermophila]
MHDHPHGHFHGHSAHGHAHDGGSRRLRLALLLTAGFMLAELAGGLWSGSLALIADAGHMLTDALALALALWAQIQGRRPADAQRSYGYHRMPVLVAFVNGLALLLVVVWIAVEAVQRLFAPPAIQAPVMLAVAAMGLAVNVGVLLILRGGAHTDLNLRGALLHVAGDLLGSVAALIAALVILATGWTPIDPLLSLLVALLILRSAWRLVRESAHVLLEGTPEGFDAVQFAQQLPQAVSGVVGIHHVHHWMLTPERSLMTLHAVLSEDADDDRVVREIKAWVRTHYRVTHVTVQTERGVCADDHHGHP